MTIEQTKVVFDFKFINLMRRPKNFSFPRQVRLKLLSSFIYERFIRAKDSLPNET